MSPTARPNVWRVGFLAVVICFGACGSVKQATGGAGGGSATGSGGVGAGGLAGQTAAGGHAGGAGGQAVAGGGGAAGGTGGQAAAGGGGVTGGAGAGGASGHGGGGAGGGAGAGGTGPFELGFSYACNADIPPNTDGEYKDPPPSDTCTVGQSYCLQDLFAAPIHEGVCRQLPATCRTAPSCGCVTWTGYCHCSDNGRGEVTVRCDAQ